MLGLLRAEEDGASLAPQPGMDQVGALVDQVSDAGLAVDLDVSGQDRALPPNLDLAAYRIVQEALANILRHAGPARARVIVRYGDRELELENTAKTHVRNVLAKLELRGTASTSVVFGYESGLVRPAGP